MEDKHIVVIVHPYGRKRSTVKPSEKMSYSNAMNLAGKLVLEKNYRLKRKSRLGSFYFYITT